MLSYTPQPTDQISPQVYQTPLGGLLFVKHTLNTDKRGYFGELAIIDDLNQALPQPFQIRQINLAHSVTNVCRGFHAESWNKLVSIVRGTAFCAIADIRPHSPTYKSVVSFTLGEAHTALKGSVYIASGLANSYCVLQGPMDYFYCVNALYRDRDKSGDSAISLFDPDLAVDWPIAKDSMLLSDRDQKALTLKQKNGSV